MSTPTTFAVAKSQQLISINPPPAGIAGIDVTNPAVQTVVLHAATSLSHARWRRLAAAAVAIKQFPFLDTKALRFPLVFCAYPKLTLSP